jgi:hypothetical protein
MSIVMDPGPVGTAGTDLDALAGQAKVRTAGLFASSDTAATGNAGWASAGSLSSCRRAWADRLDGLTEQTRAAGKALIDSAATTAGADDGSARRLDQVLVELGGR